MKTLARLWCALTGHHFIYKFSAKGTSLVCMRCPYETPGWNV